MWLGSLVATLPAIMASKKSNVTQMRVFQFLIVVLGFSPLLVGMATHFSEAYAFISNPSDKKAKILKWMVSANLLIFTFVP